MSRSGRCASSTAGGHGRVTPLALTAGSSGIRALSDEATGKAASAAMPAAAAAGRASLDSIGSANSDASRGGPLTRHRPQVWRVTYINV
eukprot:7386673-Prymnesium_polylepis.1